MGSHPATHLSGHVTMKRTIQPLGRSSLDEAAVFSLRRHGRIGRRSAARRHHAFQLRRRAAEFRPPHIVSCRDDALARGQTARSTPAPRSVISSRMISVHRHAGRQLPAHSPWWSVGVGSPWTRTARHREVRSKRSTASSPRGYGPSTSFVTDCSGPSRLSRCTSAGRQPATIGSQPLHNEQAAVREQRPHRLTRAFSVLSILTGPRTNRTVDA